MIENDLKKEYFEWMYDLVCDTKSRISYRKLLSKLNDIDFRYILPMDGNREKDGFDLRYRFGRECGYSEPIISSILDVYPCSVLEMMIALSIRCEEHIMSDPDAGNRTGQWFWNMIVNLGLGSMDDRGYDERETEKIINRFLDRKYDRNGKGGLFTVKNRPSIDMRNIEIWYQMSWYLNEEF